MAILAPVRSRVTTGTGRVRESMDETGTERVQRRAAHLLPEEVAAGSDDTQAQAGSILGDSDSREEYREPTPDLRIEHRTSEDTAE